MSLIFLIGGTIIMELIERLKNEVKANPKRIVLPEGNDINIIKAAAIAAGEGLAFPILLGKEEEIQLTAASQGINLKGIKVTDPLRSPYIDEYISEYCTFSSISEAAAGRILRKPLNYAAMMVRKGDADAMVAGITYSTEDVIVASKLIIGLKEDISVPSSYFILDTRGFQGSEDSLLVIADCAVNIDPDCHQLADIAISTARSIKQLLSWEPRVAMLSFSTKGSAAHPLIDKVIAAVRVAREKAPELLIDGEMQADAALDMRVALKKTNEAGPVAGKANILIFPNLDVGNISLKLLQKLAGARAYGAVLQGFAKPISDLSRNSDEEDVLRALILTSKTVE